MPVCSNNYSGLMNYTAVANAGARPTGTDRPPGRLIYQSDINTALVWDGVAWRGVRPRSFEGTPYATVTTNTALANDCTVPDMGVAGQILVWGLLHILASGANSWWEAQLYANGVQVATSHQVLASTSLNLNLPVQAVLAQAAGATTLLEMRTYRISIPGSGTTYAQTDLNRIDAIFVPT